MTQLEVVTAQSTVSIPFVESASGLFESMESVVGSGMDSYYNDVALLRIPGREQWVSQSSVVPHDARINPSSNLPASHIDHYRTELSGSTPSVFDLATHMENFGNGSFLRQENILDSCYMAAPAYDTTRSEGDIGAVDTVHLGLENAISFDGLTFVAAMKRGEVPVSKFYYPLLEPMFRGYYVKEVGSFLLDVAGVGDFDD